MTKFKLLLLTTILAFSLVACNNAPKEEVSKIGIIDTNRIFEESAAGKLGIERLTKMQDDMQKELEALQKDFEAKPDDADAMMKMQQSYQLFQVRYNAEQQSLVSVLDEALLKSIENVRAKLGLDIVLAKDSVLASSAKIDISTAIIEDLNAQKIELPPMQTNEAPVLPVIEDAAPATTPATDTPAAPAADAEEEDQPQAMHGY